MTHIRIYEDFKECQQLWEQTRPVESLFDLWQVRACFATAFKRPPFFLTAENNGKISGIIPLSRLDEPDHFGFFPGEVWGGRTWLEQNRIMAADARVFRELLNAIPGSAHLRYLTPWEPSLESPDLDLDEIGYLFFPKQYQYSFDAYLNEFSGKSRKKIFRETERLESSGVVWRFDQLSDAEHLFRMNLDNFGEKSYFNDPRFLKAFQKLTAWLQANEMLRITTALIGGRVAAVDVGAVLGSAYTVLAGATHPEFPGIAKLINFHHIKWACRMHLESVDFLCGDFGWKKRFHLTPRPLYQIHLHTGREVRQDERMPLYAASA